MGLRGILIFVVLAAPATAAEPMSYAGIGLGTTLSAAKGRFPSSKVVGDYIYVADRDRRDQVSGIQLAGTVKPPMVRLSFERPRDAAGRGQPQFPKCKVIEAELRGRYGAPDEVRKSAAAAPPDEPGEAADHGDFPRSRHPLSGPAFLHTDP